MDAETKKAKEKAELLSGILWRVTENRRERMKGEFDDLANEAYDAMYEKPRSEWKKELSEDEEHARYVQLRLGSPPSLLNESAEVYSFRNWIVGPNFCAGVDFVGRALAGKDEFDRFWFYGVAPGGVSESGETFEDAKRNLLNFITLVLTDLASDSTDFSDFQEKIHTFLFLLSPCLIAEWEAVEKRDQKSLEFGLKECVCLQPASLGKPKTAVSGNVHFEEDQREEKTAEGELDMEKVSEHIEGQTFEPYEPETDKKEEDSNG